MNKIAFKSQIDIVVEDQGDRYLYYSYGHHDLISFVAAVQKQESLPDYVINESDESVRMGYLDKQNKLHDDEGVDRRPVTYWYEG